jgi:hypothetical protein
MVFILFGLFCVAGMVDMEKYHKIPQGKMSGSVESIQLRVCLSCRELSHSGPGLPREALLQHYVCV